MRWGPWLVVLLVIAAALWRSPRQASSTPPQPGGRIFLPWVVASGSDDPPGLTPVPTATPLALPTATPSIVAQVGGTTSSSATPTPSPTSSTTPTLSATASAISSTTPSATPTTTTSVTASPTTMPTGLPVDVNIVAHQDDDVLFMNPDILKSLQAGHAQVTVFLTSGSFASNDIHYMHHRESGAMDGYGEMVDIIQAYSLGETCPGLNATNQRCPAFEANPGRLQWNVGTATFGGFQVVEATAVGQPIQLIFVRGMPASPAGLYTGAPITLDFEGDVISPQANLSQLWQDSTNTVQWNTVDGATSYTHAQVLQLLNAILQAESPSIIRTQNPNPTTCGTLDHSDHYYGALFAQGAIQSYVGQLPSSQLQPQYWIYHGYDLSCPTVGSVLSPNDLAAKQYLFYYYAADDDAIWPGAAYLETAYAFWYYPSPSSSTDWCIPGYESNISYSQAYCVDAAKEAGELQTPIPTTGQRPLSKPRS